VNRRSGLVGFALRQIKNPDAPGNINNKRFLGAGLMDRKMELDHLALAEKTVAQSERHILREEQMIADLDRGGHDTSLAREVLATYRRMHAEHVAHRNMLLQMLHQTGKDGPIFKPGHYEGSPQQEQTSVDRPEGNAS
jgi:hypothetical protein